MTEVAIAGVGMHPCGRLPQLSLKDLARVAVLSALHDAGMGTKDVQAVYSANAMAGVLQGQEQIRGQSVLFARSASSGCRCSTSRTPAPAAQVLSARP